MAPAKMRGPLVKDLETSILTLPGTKMLSCHAVGKDYCCTIHLDFALYGGMTLTSAYGKNRLHALTRLFVRMMQLKSGY